MSNIEKYNEARRRTLQGLTVGVAGTVVTSQQWQKPIINSVTLPAHAQSSAAFTNATVTVNDDSSNGGSLVLTEGTLMADDDDEITATADPTDSPIDDWDAGDFHPTATISPASLADDVTLTISYQNHPGQSQSLTPTPDSADTDTGVVVFPENDPSDGATPNFDDGDDGISSISYTFSALGAADVLIAVAVSPVHGDN